MRKLWIILLLLLLAGCGRGVWFRLPWSTDPPITLYPTNESHIISVPPGAWIEWDDMKVKNSGGKLIDVPGDKYHIEHWGWYLSDFYMEEIKEVKVNYK